MRDLADMKWSSVLRRVPTLEDSQSWRHRELIFKTELQELPAYEGDVSVFELIEGSLPIKLESVTGRHMTITAGDIFLGTTGYREPFRMAAGRIPENGLNPGEKYFVLCDAGVVGELIDPPSTNAADFGQVRYLGKLHKDNDNPINIRDFSVWPIPRTLSSATAVLKYIGADQGATVYLVLGTCADVGKTSASLALIHMLKGRGQRVLALKATGTPAISEIASYIDFGAVEALDCVDFGLPTTYPVKREGIKEFLFGEIDYCLAQREINAIVIECAGDFVTGQSPDFLHCLTLRRPNPHIILAAADVIGAMGSTRILTEMGLSVDFITGPCTDTPVLCKRTQEKCGVPALNLARPRKPEENLASKIKTN